MSSKARLLAMVGTRILLKDGRSMQLVYWNREAEHVQCWFPEAGNDNLVPVLVSELRMGHGGDWLFQVGAEGAQEGEESISRVFFADGQVGEMIQKAGVYAKILLGKSIVHRELSDFVSEGTQDFREIREQKPVTNTIALISYGNCGIKTEQGVGKITEWDVLREEVTVLFPDRVRKIPFSNIVPQTGVESGKKYRLQEEVK